MIVWTPPARSYNMTRNLINMLVPLFLTSFSVSAQGGIAAHYHTYFGESLDLSADSTFKYTWHFDLQASWTKGKYHIHRDTVFLTMIPVFDTLTLTDSHQKTTDSLILSDDELPERFAKDVFVSRVLSSGGQDRMPFSKILLYRKRRLYCIDVSGKLIEKKQKAIGNGKRYVPWFIKEPCNSTCLLK